MFLTCCITQIKLHGKWGLCGVGMVANFYWGFTATGMLKYLVKWPLPWYFLHTFAFWEIHIVGFFLSHQERCICLILHCLAWHFGAVPCYSICCCRGVGRQHGQALRYISAQCFERSATLWLCMPTCLTVSRGSCMPTWWPGSWQVAGIDSSPRGSQRGAGTLVARAGGCCGYSLSLLCLKLAQDFPTRPWLTRSLKGFLSVESDTGCWKPIINKDTNPPYATRGCLTALLGSCSTTRHVTTNQLGPIMKASLMLASTCLFALLGWSWRDEWLLCSTRAGSWSGGAWRAAEAQPAHRAWSVSALGRVCWAWMSLSAQHSP